jgi:TP901 family phage tail tape measure protein
LDLGKNLGIAVEEIANSAKELYRQGLNTAEVNDRLADYIKLSKVLGRDLASTIEIGTAGTTAFGTSIQKLGDIATAVGDATASSGDEIMIAIQKSGMSAQTAGVSLEELSAMAATVSATTRESGAIVGNSLFLRLSDIKNKSL